MSEPSRIPLNAGLVLLALAAQNVGAAWAKSLFPLVGTTGMTALRVGLSAVLLLAWVRPWRQPLPPRDRWNLVVYGAMLGLMNLLIYQAFERIPIGIAIAIEVTGPLAVVLLASHRVADFAWAALAIGGLALLLPVHAHAGPLDPAGVAFALGAALCWALYIAFGQRVASLRGGTAVAWGMTVAAIVTVPVGVAGAGAALLSGPVLVTGLGVAVLSSMLPYLLEMRALRHLPRRVFGLVVSAAPAIGAVAGFLLLGERLTGVQWLAGALVIGASAGAALSSRGR